MNTDWKMLQVWIGSELDISSVNPQIQPCVNRSGWCWWCNVRGIFSRHKFNSSWASFECQRVAQYCCWPRDHLYDCNSTLLVMATSLDLNPIEHLWDVPEWQICSINVPQTNYATMEQNLNVSYTLWNPWHTKLKRFQEQKGGVEPSPYLCGVPHIGVWVWCLCSYR